MLNIEQQQDRRINSMLKLSSLNIDGMTRAERVALASTLPLSSQLRLWPAFERVAGPLRNRLGREELRGFERATASLSSQRVVG